MDKRKRTNEFCKKLDNMILGRKRPRLAENEVVETSTSNDFIPNINNREIGEKLSNIENILKDNSDALKKLQEGYDKIIELLRKSSKGEINKSFISDLTKSVTKVITKVTLYPNKQELRGAVELYLRENHSEFIDQFSEHEWTVVFNDDIYQPLLKQVRSKRGTLSAKTRDAIFSLFGEVELPPINTNADPTLISEWKQKEEVARCYDRLFKPSNDEENSPLLISNIIKKVLSSHNSNVEVAFVVVICINILNPKYKQIKLDKSTTKRQVRHYLKKIENEEPLQPKEDEESEYGTSEDEDSGSEEE